MIQSEATNRKGYGSMDRKKRSRARAGRTRYTVLLSLVIVLSLALIAGVLWRMLGWRGQHTEGRLSTTALVNPWNSVEATGFAPNLVTVRDFQVDQSCAASLEQMLADCEAAGFHPVITAAYHSVSELEANPALTPEDDTAGYSEHELGLAVDFQSSADGTLNWLKENACQYGFILRYPAGAEELTGMAASETHFRYVGPAAANQIHQLGITLEEYVTMFYNDAAAIEFEK